ncbi:hypothetical protein LdCL_330030600 [Leishmania donovani]|uniref:PH-like domain-containing protein n=1 Tax=Leishmania donovani TaxID=5661 RepID=A0A3Q8IKB2_LEIDO|nr:hypothetical protein LdCL_330030600 [Leishmania donovani]
MAASFVPRFQLNTSRSSARSGDGFASRLDRTTAPYAASARHSANKGAGTYNDSGRRYPLFSALSSNNNTFLTNNTSGSDWLRDGYAGGRDAGAAAEPLSPTPRVSEAAACLGGGWAGPHQPYADPQLGGSDDDGGHREGSDSGGRGIPGPSATRPLFTSSSASLPRDRNVIAGNTGRLTWTDSAGVTGGEETAACYSSYWPRSAGTGSTCGPGRWGQRSSDPAPSSTARPAFTSTLVGTSSGAMSFSRHGYCGGGVVLSDADWRGARTTADGAFDWGADVRGGGTAGLVNSRSRARVDRWTDEEPCRVARSKEMPIWNDAPTMATDSSSISPEERPRSQRHRRRQRHQRGSHHGRSGGGGGVNSNGSRHDRAHDDDDDDFDSMRDGAEDDSLSFAEAIVSAMDAQPVVPPGLLRNLQEPPFIWNRHPSHGIVLCLLQHRGIYLPRYRELVDYHMAELFLHYLDLCREGAFFIHYSAGKWPKERFFRIRMLPVNRLEAETEPVPHLVITLHESGVDILDAIPLDELVGVTATPQTACFLPFLESPKTIIGCREGRGHRARLPADGAFSLWFYDVAQHKPRSVDILTCDAKVFDIWTKTFRGLVSVNSSSIVQVALTPQGESVELAELTRAAQQQGEVERREQRGRLSSS